MANKVIKIGDYTITENSRPYMIAEIGINHNGDIDIDLLYGMIKELAKITNR